MKKSRVIVFPDPVAKLLELHGGAAAVAALGQAVARVEEEVVAPVVEASDE